MFGLEAIWRNGQVVGHVRRADFGFTVNKTIAYGYIRDPSGGPVSPVPCPFPGSTPDVQDHTCACWEHRRRPGRAEECLVLVSSSSVLLVFSFISKRN